jgi:hypothetical protein
VPWIADINERKDIVNSYKLDRPEGISVGSFVDNMGAQSDFFVGFNLHPNKNRKQVLSSSGIY